MQGFDKEIITNAMAKMMESLFRGESSKGRSKHWQPSRLSKKTRLKRKKAARRVVESGEEIEGNHTTNTVDASQQGPRIQVDSRQTDEEGKEGVRVEALNTDSEEEENHNMTKGPPLRTEEAVG